MSGAVPTQDHLLLRVNQCLCVFGTDCRVSQEFINWFRFSKPDLYPVHSYGGAGGYSGNTRGEAGTCPGLNARNVTRHKKWCCPNLGVMSVFFICV